MAIIQGVGGSKVYVITGDRDPRFSSTGQSWANLVTSQKYRLWEEAQKEALAQIQDEQSRFELQQEIRRDLAKQRAEKQGQLVKLQTKQVDAGNALRDDYLRAKASYDKGYRTGRSSKTDPNTEREKFLKETRQRRKDYSQDEKSLKAELRPLQEEYAIMVQDGEQFEPAGVALKARIDAYEGTTASPGPLRKAREQKIFQDKILVAYGSPSERKVSPYTEDELKEIKKDIDEQKGYSDKIESKYTGSSSVAGRKPPEQALYEEQALQAGQAYDPQIRQLEQEIAALSQEISGISTTRPEMNRLEKARQIYRQDFGGRPAETRPGLVSTRQPGEVERFIEDSGFTTERGFPQQPQPLPSGPQGMTPQRRAELEAKGVDEERINKILYGEDWTPPMEATPVGFGVEPRPLTQGEPLYDGVPMSQAFPPNEDISPGRDLTPAGQIYRQRAFDADLENPDRENITPRQIDDLYALGELYVEDQSLSGEVFPSAPTKRRATYDEYLAQRQDAMLKLAGTEKSAQMKNVALRPEAGRITAQQLEEQKVREYAPMLTESYPEQFGEFGDQPGQTPYPQRLGDVYTMENQARQREVSQLGREFFGEQMALPYEPPSQPKTSRELEMEALGLDQLLYEESPKPPTLSKPLRYKYNVIRNAEKYEQSQVDKIFEDKNNIPQWAKLVIDSYDPKTGTEEQLRKAWDNITIEYNDDPKTRQKAHELLLALDRLEKQKAQIK